MLPSVLGASFSKIEQPVEIFSNDRLRIDRQNGIFEAVPASTNRG